MQKLSKAMKGAGESALSQADFMRRACIAPELAEFVNEFIESPKYSSRCPWKGVVKSKISWMRFYLRSGVDGPCTPEALTEPAPALMEWMAIRRAPAVD